MKIKIYIVTYKGDNVLNQNLDSLYSSDLLDYEYEICIINNHTQFDANVDRPNLRVVHNAVRPNFSTGHLARDWNFALIDGFRDLKNPQSDIVITCQNDTVFFPNWVSYIISLHKKYSFITFGHGDNMMSWTPNAVKTIGLWDERFCTIQYQEADYFLRAYKYNKERTSLNDHAHGRLHNEEENKVVDVTYSKNEENREAHDDSKSYRKICNAVYHRKWDNYKWNESRDRIPNKPNLTSYIMYPYFEKDLYKSTLKQQRYLLGK